MSREKTPFLKKSRFVVENYRYFYPVNLKIPAGTIAVHIWVSLPYTTHRIESAVMFTAFLNSHAFSQSPREHNNTYVTEIVTKGS